jgi:peptide/nickel transport system ATP-binding protein
MIVHALISLEGTKKYFPVQKSFVERFVSRQSQYVKAVDGVSFEVQKGEVFGLVGESGSGKTTTGFVILGLIRPDEGKVLFDNIDMTKTGDEEFRVMRKRMQMVFQDPSSALHPRMKIGQSIMEPLRIHRTGSAQERKALALQMLETVGLEPVETFFDRYPHELSGGQKQRVVIARALILHPELVVADEPVAMVDVSVRVQILDLMMRLKKELDLTYVFITHDLSAASYVCDRIAVMYLGKLLELAPTDELFDHPQHPYTRALLAAVPIPDPNEKRDKVLPKGEIPSPINPPSGCRFHPRCDYAVESCRTKEPILEEVSAGHYVACAVLPFREAQK